MSDNIPFEIQVEIIKKLPIKSLIQFRSVSKTWKSLIDSSQFIADYHQQTHLQHHILIRDAYEHNYASFVDDDTFPCQKNTLTVPESANELPIVGCSQGLICFYNYWVAKTAVIWNPAIRKSVDVFVPRVFDGRVSSNVIGFGVCPRTLDPILVKIKLGDRTENSSTWLVEVFRLSLGVWKSLSLDLPRSSITVRHNCQVVIDTFIYWLAFDQTSGCHLIMSFDMTSEEFTEIRLPDSLLGVNAIRELKESLVVLQYDRDSKDGFGVWMMDNGDPTSFKKIYTIKSKIPDAPMIKVLAFGKNGEPIVAMTKEVDKSEVELFVYERNSRHFNHIGISAKRFVCLESYSYKETLLLQNLLDIIWRQR